jgi:hypothetical protein
VVSFAALSCRLPHRAVASTLTEDQTKRELPSPEFADRSPVHFNLEIERVACALEPFKSGLGMSLLLMVW